MVNIVIAELLKMRKNHALLFSALLVFALPVFMITVPDAPPDYGSWLMQNQLFATCMTLPIMSGFVITILVQREYQEQTVINILISQVSRNKFVLSKLTAWFIWYLTTLFVMTAIYIWGFYMLYPEGFNLNRAVYFFGRYSKTGLLSFTASLPLLWIAIKQRGMFYPSLVSVIIFTAVQVGATQVSESSILLLSIAPWSAVTLNSMELPAPYSGISLISIFTAGILGIILSCFSFGKQDQ